MQKFRIALTWVHTSLFILTVPFIILAFFAFPAADDYCIANFVSENGFLNSQFLLFQQMNGRYLSTFLISAFTIEGIWLYRAGLISIILLFLGSLIHAERHLLKQKSQPTITAIAAFLLFFNMFPQIAEVVYWLSGAVTYLFTLSLIIIFAVRFIKIRNAESIKGSHYFILIVLLILIGGAHELGLLACAAFLLWFLFFDKNSNQQFVFIVSLLILAISLILFTSFAGAGSERMSYYSHVPFYEKIKLSVLSNIKLHLLIFLNIPFLISALSVLILARPTNTTLWSVRKTLISSCYIFASATVLLAVHPLFTGLAPPVRVYSFLSVLYIPAILLLIYKYKSHFLSEFSLELKQRKVITISFSLLFIISLFSGFHKNPGGRIVFTGNVVASLYDLAVNVKPYSEEMNDREHLTISAANKNADTLILPMVKHKPHTLFFLDISDTHPEWIILCYKKHYHFDGVIIFDKPGAKKHR
jgi:hypothetical protein